MIDPAEFVSHSTKLVRQPTEVEWRRAVSAAYYGLFHALAWSGAGQFGFADATTLAQVARAFDHSTMYKVCRSYLDTEKRRTASSHLIVVAEAFAELQNARYQADYDLTTSFSQIEATRLVTSAAQALYSWPRIDDEPKRAFLAQLLLGPRLNRRG